MQRPCPVCRTPASQDPANRDRPFCSERCRFIDLSRWMSGEEYVVVEPLGIDPELLAGPDED